MVSAKLSISFLNLFSYKTVCDSCSVRILENNTSIPASFPSKNSSEDKEAGRHWALPGFGGRFSCSQARCALALLGATRLVERGLMKHWLWPSRREGL